MRNCIYLGYFLSVGAFPVGLIHWHEGHPWPWAAIFLVLAVGTIALAVWSLLPKKQQPRLPVVPPPISRTDASERVAARASYAAPKETLLGGPPMFARHRGIPKPIGDSPRRKIPVSRGSIRSDLLIVVAILVMMAMCGCVEQPEQPPASQIGIASCDAMPGASSRQACYIGEIAHALQDRAACPDRCPPPPAPPTPQPRGAQKTPLSEDCPPYVGQNGGRN